MGILNATPDSFSDGGSLNDPETLKERVRSMIRAGADILDVGGESTRPGHEEVSLTEELERVIPVIHTIRMQDPDIIISIDTRKAAVAQAALSAGATMVNDVSGLGDPDMAGVVKRHGCPVILMRNKDLAGDMVAACREELDGMVMKARRAGIPDGRVILDPGLGFGKRPGPNVEDNLALLDGVQDYAQGFQVLIGASRKRFVGTWADEPDARKRDAASAQLAVRAVKAGASIVRVHDVAGMVNALKDVGLR